MVKYIHYGSTKFDPNIGFPIKNQLGWTKPYGGLWASRVHCKFGWKDWCTLEDFRECNDTNAFTFTLKKSANVVTIRCVDDIFKLPQIRVYQSYLYDYTIDFEECLHQNIDAIELLISEIPRQYDKLYYALYCWDCDSILILNPSIIRI